MTFENTLARVAHALERAQVSYMLTGSVTSSAHGKPRCTRDIDVVIAPTPQQIRDLIREFPGTEFTQTNSKPWMRSPIGANST